MNRRGFLRFLGIGASAPVWAPMAGAIPPAAAPAAIGSVGYGLMDNGPPVADAVRKYPTTTAIRKLGIGVPDFVKQQIWHRAAPRRIDNGWDIDADIDAVKSFSLAAKLVLQRRRNYERNIASFMNETPWSKARKDFIKAFGFKDDDDGEYDPHW